MIRVNPDIFTTVLTGIEQSRQQSNNLLEQVASGRRVNAYSDDPAASATMVYNRAQSSLNDQFTRNISDLKAVLQTGDSAMSSAVTALTRALTLGIQGANGTLSDTDRQALAAEVDGIQQQMLSIANSSVSGNYIFSGTNVSTPAFVADAASASGVRYQGNSGVNSLELQPGQTTAINIPGSQLFTSAAGNVFQALNDLKTSLSSNGDVAGAVSSVRTAMNEVSGQRSFYGQVINQMDAASNALAQDKVRLQSQENDLTGADLAKVATDLSQTQITQNALMAAAGKVSQYTLFDFLK